jgi:hypothetical protein
MGGMLKMKIKLTPDIHQLCWDFATKCAKTNLDEYAKRNQFNAEKITNDIYYGKLAEFASAQYLKSFGKFSSQPDLGIYGPSQTHKGVYKSFEADLHTDTRDYHVKSITSFSAAQHGISWLLQKKDPVVSRPTARDCFIFILIHEDEMVEVLDVVSALRVQYSKPRLKKLWDTKVAIYWEQF